MKIWKLCEIVVALCETQKKRKYKVKILYGVVASKNILDHTNLYRISITSSITRLNNF